MEEVEILRLGFEMPVAPKPLGAEESFVVGVIEALHGSVPPGFADWDKDGFDSQKQTEPEDDPEGAGIAIASPKAKLVVELKKIGQSHDFPAADQALHRRIVVFSSLGMEEDPVAVEIDDVERKEPSVALDISRSDKIGLVDMVASQRFGEIRVFHPFGGVGSFF